MGNNNDIEQYLEKLGQRIAKLRKSKGLTQDDLWYQAELSRRTINKLELGQGDVKLGTLLKVCKALDIPIEKLVKV